MPGSPMGTTCGHHHQIKFWPHCTATSVCMCSLHISNPFSLTLQLLQIQSKSSHQMQIILPLHLSMHSIYHNPNAQTQHRSESRQQTTMDVDSGLHPNCSLLPLQNRQIQLQTQIHSRNHQHKSRQLPLQRTHQIKCCISQNHNMVCGIRI